MKKRGPFPPFLALGKGPRFILHWEARYSTPMRVQGTRPCTKSLR